MKLRRTYRSGLLLLLLALVGSASAQEPQPAVSTDPEAAAAADSTLLHGAVLRLAETQHDFGDVPRRGGDLHCEIRFTNAGDAPLVVSRLVTSNSCLKAACSRRPVAPGGQGTIRIVYQPIKSEAGAFSRVIQIGSNAAAGDTQITVCGNSFEEEPAVRKGRGERTKLKIKRKR